MPDYPIIFSGPMVKALIAGRKTQTRRLVTSPLARCVPGDRLYVREAWRPDYASEGWRDDLQRVAKPGDFDPATTGIEYLADGERELGGRDRPGMRMPRWASRLTLIVEDVRVERLQAISDDDVWAEGICSAVEEHDRANGKPAWGDIPRHYRRLIVEQTFGSTPRAFQWLWSGLHDKPGQRWEDDPFVVALTFRVVHGNIDRIAS